MNRETEMKSALLASIILSLVTSISALASKDPRECISECDVINEETKDLKCEVYLLNGAGAVMFVDILKDPMSAKDKVRLYHVRDCFFEADGGTFEVHRPGKTSFHSCSKAAKRAGGGVFCEGAPEKESLRHAKNLKKLKH
jgi:hypothetical protein